MTSDRSTDESGFNNSAKNSSHRLRRRNDFTPNRSEVGVKVSRRGGKPRGDAASLDTREIFRQADREGKFEGKETRAKRRSEINSSGREYKENYRFNGARKPRGEYESWKASNLMRKLE